ncbi:OmpA family protein [Tellurirhabdus bombi]|uniref:OmpA family protein n=1 Tax=Tellurirhabdus bombi TaxID=2907205 RepID=UPI001F36A6EB|nr:OmpA family protein [Tellurirhabdus bombi]
MLTNKMPWIVLLLLWMGGSAYWHVCRVKQLCPNFDTPAPMAFANSSAPTFIKPAASLNDGNNFILNSPDNLAFAKSGSSLDMNTVSTVLDSLATYLKNNPNRRLLLTGLFGADEQNSSNEPNLGIARAEALRAFLIRRGVATNQLLIQGKQATDLVFSPNGDSLYNTMRYTFLDELTIKGQKPSEEETLAKAEKYSSVFEPVNLYFNTGQTTYIATEATRTFLNEAQQFLNEHPDQKLRITGYTDNVGTPGINLTLSRVRANAVKEQFIKAGISASQIEVAGKGEAQPVASNNTAEGRRANRRATIVVIK